MGHETLTLKLEALDSDSYILVLDSVGRNSWPIDKNVQMFGDSWELFRNG